MIICPPPFLGLSCQDVSRSFLDARNTDWRRPESLDTAQDVNVKSGQGGLTSEGSIIRGGEGAVDRDTVASNCSTGNRLSDFNKRISSKGSNKFELDEGFQPYHSPFRLLSARGADIF